MIIGNHRLDFRKIMAKLFLLPLSLIFITGLGGCAGLGADPWDRDLLAKEAMLLNPDPLESSFDDHIYFSREASSGGRGFGGGGCGCN